MSRDLHSRRVRRRLAAGFVAAVALGVLAAGCTAGPAAAPTPGHAVTRTDRPAGLPSAHVHGVAVNPGDGRVYLATHHGLFRYGDTGPQRVGPVIDLMGFTVAGPDHFYASGHPGPGTDLPDPVGLLESVDAGITWTPLSRQGSSDFHALTASAAGIVGFDGRLRASSDGTTWTELSDVDAPSTLAAAPGGATLLSAGRGGVSRSTDGGRTWTTLSAAPRLVVLSWADDDTVVGVTADGAVEVSADRGVTWQPRGVTAEPQAVAAVTQAGALRILVVIGSGLLDSVDGGHTFTTLT